MAVAAQGAEWIGLEGIIGTFLSGVALKRAFGETPADDSLEVMSQTLLIPIFFVAAGFLVDFKVFFATLPLVLSRTLRPGLLNPVRIGGASGQSLRWPDQSGGDVFALAASRSPQPLLPKQSASEANSSVTVDQLLPARWNSSRDQA
jgi:hypothetical protein